MTDPTTLKKVKTACTKFCTDYKVQITYLKQLAFVVFFYGLMITFVLAIIFGYKFTITRVLAYGLVAYIIKAELPQIISGCFPKPPPVIPFR